MRERVEVQLVDRNDLLMAEVKLNDARYQLMQAENGYEVARMSLNSFVGEDFESVLPVDTLVVPIYSVGTLPGYRNRQRAIVRNCVWHRIKSQYRSRYAS